MKNRITIILSILLVVMCALCLTLFIANKKDNYYLVVYNPQQESSETYKVKKGSKFSDYIGLDNTTIGYFTDDKYSAKINLEDIITSNLTIIKGNIVTMYDDSAFASAAGLRYVGSLDEQKLNYLLDNYIYLDISNSTILSEFPFFNGKVQTLILPHIQQLSGINNFKQLNSVTVNSENVINCFNSCENLNSVKFTGLQSLDSSFNNCQKLTSINLGPNLNSVKNSFVNCCLNEIKTTSQNFLIENGVLYGVDDGELSAIKAFNVKQDITLNINTVNIDEYAFSSVNTPITVNIGSNITTIKSNAFNSSGVKQVNISNSRVLTIQNKAFYNCSNLLSVKLGNAVQSIQSETFSFSAIEEIDLSDTILTSIGDSAFKNCKNLKTVKLNNSKITLGKSAFYGCTSLKNITGLDVSQIEEETFYNCTALTNINRLNNLNIIKQRAFFGSGVTSLEFAPYVISILEQGFANCTKLLKVEVFNLENIKTDAFKGCTSLYVFKNMGSIKILEDCLQDCPIKELNISGENIIQQGAAVYSADKTTLIYYAKADDSTQYTLPATVNSIGFDAVNRPYRINGYTLSSADNLSQILVEDGSSIFSSVDGVLYFNNSILISYPSANKRSTFITPDFVTTISAKAFNNCPNLTKLTFSSKVSNVYFNALNNLKSLTELDVDFIGQSKNNVNSAYLGYIFGATSYQNNHMYVPTSLLSVKVNEQTEFAEGCFFDCPNLTSIVLENCTNITLNMFNGCASLKFLTINKPLQKIEKYSFYDCSKLSVLTLGYYKDLVIKDNGILGIARNITVKLKNSDDLSPEDYDAYKKKFTMVGWISNWTWQTQQ